MIMKINEGLRSKLVFFFFWFFGGGGILCILGWPEIHYAIGGDLELLILLQPSTKSCDYLYYLCGARDQTWGFGHVR